jgi:seryl-tRNA synthetase
MLDIKAIRQNPDEFRRRLASRGPGAEGAIDTLLAQDEERRRLLHEVETLKAERNRASKEIAALKSKGESAEDVLGRMKETAQRIAGLESRVTEVEAVQRDFLLRTPNVPHASVPAGHDPGLHNRVERQVGQPRKFDFQPKPHWELGEALGILDFQRAAKISGSGFIVYRGAGARLERALVDFLLDLHTREHGYTEVGVPFLVRAASMEGTGQLPKFAEDMYAVRDEDLYLVPTAEVPVTNLHREEILEESQLPIAYAAATPCFRREAGSAGKDTRGMIRVHQFDKVELVHITRPEESYATLERLVGHAERALQDLELTYRVVSLCSGDMGFAAAKCYDLEVWAPGTGAWLEVSSCSNFEDFQARRMNLRFRDAGADKNVMCHTLNGSGTALARLYIALLETHQGADGRVRLPAKLQPYIGREYI